MTFTRPTSALVADSEKGGKAYIFYPGGFLYSGLESVINTTSPMDNIPGLIDFTLQSFTFRQFFKKQAAAYRDLAVAKFGRPWLVMVESIFASLGWSWLARPW